jgi:hypothetical protein
MGVLTFSTSLWLPGFMACSAPLGLRGRYVQHSDRITIESGNAELLWEYEMVEVYTQCVLTGYIMSETGADRVTKYDILLFLGFISLLLFSS